MRSLTPYQYFTNAYILYMSTPVPLNLLGVNYKKRVYKFTKQTNY